MAVATDIWPSLRTFGRNFDQNVVYNTEIRIYGHMTVKLAFITQATISIKFREFVDQNLLKLTKKVKLVKNSMINIMTTFQILHR
jgi:hypothetical protein